jgi:hypothetical protein
MRRKVRGTLQINEDVKRLFMLAKPLHVTSSDFLKELLLLHAREVREAQQRSPKPVDISIPAGPDTLEDRRSVGRVTCLGRPPGATDLRPRNRRTKKEMARGTRNLVSS